MRHPTVVLGGSFNPPHICHVQISLALMQLLSYEELLILPSGDHPEKELGASFEDRYQMCKTAFRHLDSVRVSRLENKLPNPTYTYDTLSYLREKKGRKDIKFVIGSDLVQKIPHWKKGEKIKEIASFIVIPRQGYPIVSVPEELGNFERLEIGINLPQLSSTHIRDILRNGGDVSNLIDQKIHQYIKGKELYKP